MALFNVSQVVAAHHRSLVEPGRSMRRALMAVYGPPTLALGAIAAARFVAPCHLELDSGLSASLAAAFALLAGVMFGLSLTVLDKAIDMDLMGATPGPVTERAVERMQAIAASTLFTAIISGGATGLLVLGELVPSTTEVATALAVAAIVLVATNSLMVAGRVFSETKWRTDRARTGESARTAVEGEELRKGSAGSPPESQPELGET